MKKINWTAALSKPVNEITEEETISLLQSARDWKLCACGNHCQKLPRGAAGEPRDKKLFTLGVEFEICVNDLNFSIRNVRYRLADFARRKALAIHNKIERRAALLIKRMEVKP